MPKTGVGDRSGWKDRIEKSSWVDSSRWVDKGESSDPVEFLEAEPSAYRLSQAQKKPPPAMSSTAAKALVLGAAGVVLIALAIMSRPGDQDPASQLSVEEQLLRQREAAAAELLDEEGALADETTDDGTAGDETGEDSIVDPEDAEDAEDSASAEIDAAFDAEAAADAESASEAGQSGTGLAATLPPIPELRADLPEDFPGVLFGYGPQESVVTIRRSVPTPVESLLDADGGGPAGMVQTSPSEVAVFTGGRLFSLPTTGGVEQSELPDGTVHPGDDGFLVLLEQDRQRQAFVLGGPGTEDVEPGAPIDVGNDVTVLGSWAGQALVYQASKVWSLDDADQATAVTDGVLVDYDGTHLAMVRCDRPSACRIEVGTPAQPSRRSVPVPETLAGRDIALWASIGAVSPDGTKLAIVDHRGAVQLPTWIDLETGEAQTVSESVDPASPVVWSPDGRWLAYSFADDLLVWDTELQRTWRIFLGRDIDDLAWLVDGELDS